MVRHCVAARIHRARRIGVIAEAGNGYDALRLSEVLVPDVLLLDIKMPMLTGIEVAPRSIRC